jgi:hypothetical protein
LVVRSPSVKNLARDVMTPSSFAGATFYSNPPRFFAGANERKPDSVGNGYGATKEANDAAPSAKLSLTARSALVTNPQNYPQMRSERADVYFNLRLPNSALSSFPDRSRLVLPNESGRQGQISLNAEAATGGASKADRILVHSCG